MQTEDEFNDPKELLKLADELDAIARDLRVRASFSVSPKSASARRLKRGVILDLIDLNMDR